MGVFLDETLQLLQLSLYLKHAVRHPGCGENELKTRYLFALLDFELLTKFCVVMKNVGRK